ncbi:helix-turn-helix transcriptional regulator [Pedobacter sp. PLR]|uniref:AraC family transcriptional regulator n=1 Tax=Pedobacter sp. PLR TaxID=2994465 RepID=UPI002245F075|nr:helix-turn-helix transcriptional regulator [Pedobacter sp. PLR]MCX2449756.1 helix-turn-helix transcriptional regulator [Pedobacter sp. PLR]
MTNKSSPIPLFKLQERGKALFEVLQLEPEWYTLSTHPAHRDDYYVLIHQESGSTRLMVDFQEVVIEGAAIFCIFPGQVHYGISTEETLSYVIVVDPVCIQDPFRMVLMEAGIQNTLVNIDQDESTLLKDCIQLLQTFDSEKYGSFDEQPKRAMLDVCLSLFTVGYQKKIRSSSPSNLRTTIINREFRSLLLMSYRTMKSPSEYAASLNLSPSYLNEAVKESSGYPVSYWIHQEIVMEAKRMLYYSDNTVKEIAYNLGYSDPAYFIRLFTKIVGIPPMHFRKKHRI